MKDYYDRRAAYYDDSRTRERLPAAALVCAAAPDLPFADQTFDRLYRG